MLSARTAFRKQTAAVNAVKFQNETQAVWAEPDLEKKRLLVRKMVESFKYREKQNQFLISVEQAKTGLALDKLATQIMLYGDGLSIV